MFSHGPPTPQLLLKMTRERRLTLPIPPLDEIPNGTFAQIDVYINLMQQCLSQTPEERPASFKVIMDQLGCVVHAYWSAVDGVILSRMCVC